ncbi:hypothetical protein MPSEU_001083700 [Mayamaea pseudoterrestris]|nr:hypothetical protein MPSEU_001083700 [Mayamaea pseudoterrestris]
MDINWEENEGHEELIRKVTSDGSRIHALVIDSVFVNNFSNLREIDANKTAKALEKNNRVSGLRLEASFELRTPIMELLYTTLAAMTKTASIYGPFRGDSTFSVRHATILRNMPFIKLLHLQSRFANEQVFRELHAALNDHSSLENIYLVIPTESYPMILPALNSIRTLKFVTLAGSHGISSSILPDAAFAIAGLLRSMGQGSTQSATFNFLNLDVRTERSQEILCQGIAASRIFCLSMMEISFADPSTLAIAITASGIRSLTCHGLRFPGQQTADFFRTMAQSVHLLTHLERMHIGRDAILEHRVGNGADQRATELANDRAIAQLVSAAAQCLKLKSLTIFVHEFVSDLDEALAACVAPDNDKLKHIAVHCSSLSDDAPKLNESPWLAEALKSNYSVCTIRLQSGRIEPWTANFKSSLQTIPMLNMAGRKYLKLDIGDDAAGLQMLGAVRNHLDCIFYHLAHENPSLCEQARSRARERMLQQRRRPFPVAALQGHAWVG